MKTRIAIIAIITVALGATAAQAQTGEQQIVVRVAPAARVATTVRVAAVAHAAPVVAMYGDDTPGTAYLGVDTRDVTKERVTALKLKDERGVEVTMVDQDAPAGKAGLKEGDVILSFNGNSVESFEQLRRMIRETPPGRTVKLGIWRNGSPMDVSVELADRRKFQGSMVKPRVYRFEMPNIEIPPMPDFEIPQITVVTSSSVRTGLVVEGLTRQLAEFFGVKNGEGLLVKSVEKGSPAEAAGFRAGDVIVKAGTEQISDAGDWRRAIRGAAGSKVGVTVIRDKKETPLTLTLPEREQGGNYIVSPDDFDMEMDFESPEIRAQVRKEMTKAREEMRKAQSEQRKTFEAQRKALRDAQRERERIEREKQREQDRDEDDDDNNDRN